MLVVSKSMTPAGRAPRRARDAPRRCAPAVRPMSRDGCNCGDNEVPRSRRIRIISWYVFEMARVRKRHDQLAIDAFRRRPDKNGQWRGAPRYADMTLAERRKAKKRGPTPKGKRASEGHRA